MTRRKPWSCPTASRCCGRENWSRWRRRVKFTVIRQRPTRRSSSGTPICCARMCAMGSCIAARSSGHRTCRRDPPCFPCVRKTSKSPRRPARPEKCGFAEGCGIRRFTARANCCKSSAPTASSSACAPKPAATGRASWNSNSTQRTLSLFATRGPPNMFSRAYRAVVTVPPLLWITVFLLVPYALMFCYSFWTVSPSQTIVPSWNLANYRQLFTVDVYWQTLLRSMWIAARVMLFSLLLGYPLAYFLSFYAGAKKDLFYQLVIIPLWVSYLVRAYAWKTILGSDGVLNTLLQYVHLTKHPVEFLLYSPFAVVLTLTHIYTPFTFLPIYASMEHIPRNFMEAAQDLGAGPIRTFWTVIFPLSLPGALAGATFAFVLSLGDFLAPLLIGGPSGTMIANLVQSLFGAAYAWPLGAAISVFILIITLLLLALTQRVEKRWSFE